MIHLASGSGSAEACIDLTKWAQRPLGVREMLRGYYHLFLKLNHMKKEEKKRGLRRGHPQEAQTSHSWTLTLLVIPVKHCACRKFAHVLNEH